MSSRKILSVLVVALMLGAGAHALAQGIQATEALDDVGAAFPPGGPCPVLTIAKGPMSGFGMNRPGFAGAELIINGPDAWVAFWSLHTAGHEPAPPPPPVDFGRFVVLAAIQGPQTSGGGPNIAVLDVHQRDMFTVVRIFDDPRPGDLDVITNPFHIVAVPRPCLSPESSLLVERVRPRPETGVVEGRVLTETPDGHMVPVPFAEVTLRAANADTDPPVSISGFDGSYFFVNVPPGRYVLVAQKEGFEPVREPVEVPPNARVGRELILVHQTPETGAVAGHVGTARAGAIWPVPGALVLLIDPQASRPGIVAETHTNDRGAYGFADVEPKRYVVHVEHPDFLPQSAVVGVTAGQTVEQNFLLEPRPQDVGALTGHVVGVRSDQTVPLPGVLVRVMNADGEIRRTRTDNEGAFAFEGLPAGQYGVAAFKRGWAPARMPVEIVAGETTDVTIELMPAQAPASAAGESGVETNGASPATEEEDLHDL